MGALVACAVALLATPLARRIAFALGVLDRPAPLKVQQTPVAYLGGAAVLVAIAVALAPSRPMWILPLALAAALGIADDVRALSPAFRLAAQCVIGLVAGVVAPGPGPAGFLVTAGCVVVLMNALNLIDGMDALASLTTAAIAFGFVAVGGDGRVLALAMGGAVAGFLVYNWPPARIYLGDGGAYLLGAATGMLAAQSLTTDAATWIAVPFLVALPVADAAIAIVRRRLSGRPVMAGDRSHLYDQLFDRGWTVPRIVCTFALVQLVASGLGIWIREAPTAVGALAATAAGLLALLTIWRARFVRRGALT